MILLHPLWLILGIVLLLLALVFRRNTSHDDWHKVIATPVLKYLRTNNIKATKQISWALIAASLCALALSSPATRINNNNTLLHSSTWLVLLDVSRSMTTEDVAPSRLSAARNTLLQLSRAADSRSLGLIVYAGDAFLTTPPAFDKRMLEETTALIEYGLIPQEGSNLVRALSLASSVVADSQLTNGRLFLLTDSGGVNQSSEAAVRHLKTQGQRLDVILYGAPGGDPNIAVNTAEVKALASAGGGTVLQASNFGEVNLDSLNLDKTNNNDLFAAELTALQWQNQSHWILLLLLPVLLQLFRVEAIK